MIKKIKENLQLAALVIPAYALLDEGGGTVGGGAGSPGKISIEAPTAFEGLARVTVSGIVSGLVSFSLIIVSIVFFFILVFGGLKWITSGGDEKKVAAARSSVTNALIGLAIVFASWAIISLMQAVFHINIFSFTLPQF